VNPGSGFFTFLTLRNTALPVGACYNHEMAPLTCSKQYIATSVMPTIGASTWVPGMADLDKVCTPWVLSVMAVLTCFTVSLRTVRVLQQYLCRIQLQCTWMYMLHQYVRKHCELNSTDVLQALIAGYGSWSYCDRTTSLQVMSCLLTVDRCL